MELSRALYLLYTGKMVEIPEELFNTSYDILFTHFTNKLLARPHLGRNGSGVQLFLFLQSEPCHLMDPREGSRQVRDPGVPSHPPQHPDKEHQSLPAN